MIGTMTQDARVQEALAKFQNRPVQEIEKLAAKGGEKLENLREAAQGFESIFIQMLLKSMRSTVKKSGLLDGGKGEEIFTGMMDQNFAEATSNRDGGIGLAKMIVKKYAKYVATPEAGTGSRVDLKAGE